ncbi:MAG: ABC transporter permease subunit [Hyphomicrobiales bacterium]|nr:ABC transporter permease subunit [Hyphomicrobiales bacterium]
MRDFLLQALLFGIVLALAGFLVFNVAGNLGARSIHTGFAFLHSEAGFDIGESFLPYDGRSSYGRALLVGLLNTLAVSSAGIVLSTLIGVFVGLGRLSGHPLVGPLASGYVEALRNVPLLLQLYLWYAILNEVLAPDGSAPAFLPGFYLAKSGLHFPVLERAPLAPLFALCAGFAAAAAWTRFAEFRQAQTGSRSASWPAWSLALLPAALLLARMLATDPFGWPQQRRFGFAGGGTLSPELTALLLGLSFYNGAFVAEILRGAIRSVAPGQSDAAAALGLRFKHRLRLIVLPQALRVAVPPLASQYLNLAKNSSLAVAIGYPDLMSVGNTIVNQTGQALEVIGMVMAAYLTLSLSIAAFMNWYNARVRLEGPT